MASDSVPIEEAFRFWFKAQVQAEERVARNPGSVPPEEKRARRLGSIEDSRLQEEMEESARSLAKAFDRASSTASFASSIKGLIDSVGDEADEGQRRMAREVVAAAIECLSDLEVARSRLRELQDEMRRRHGHAPRYALDGVLRKE